MIVAPSFADEYAPLALVAAVLIVHALTVWRTGTRRIAVYTIELAVAGVIFETIRFLER